MHEEITTRIQNSRRRHRRWAASEMRQAPKYHSNSNSADITARASVGSMRNAFRNQSPAATVGTRATPTSLARLSCSRWPWDEWIVPEESSEVSSVDTIKGGAVYSGPAVKRNSATNSSLISPVAGSKVPASFEGAMAMFSGGGMGIEKMEAVR